MYPKHAKVIPHGKSTSVIHYTSKIETHYMIVLNDVEKSLGCRRGPFMIKSTQKSSNGRELLNIIKAIIKIS